MHKAALLLALGSATIVVPAFAQAQPAPPPPIDRAAAYYHYSLAHMYADLAGSMGSRDYLNKAIENYKLAIKDDPKTPMITEELSELYIQANRLREAQTDAEEILRQNPSDLSARRILARIFTRQIGDSQQNKIDENMLKKAIEQYQKIVEIDPKDVDSYVMLGRLYKVSQKSPEAEKAYKQALAIDADNEDALTGLASVYADLGDTTSASELLRKLSAKNPSPRSLTALATAYEQMREFNLAAESLKRALELNPPNAGELKRALAQDQMFAEQYKDALKTYQGIVAEEPTDAQSYLRISQIQRQLRDFAAAREAGEKARSLEPTNLEVRYNEVSILEAEGKTNDAIVKLKDILDSTAKKNYSQNDRATRAELLRRLFILHRELDQTEAAVAVLRQMTDLDPEQAAATSAEIIDTYRLGKEFQKAEAEANAALKKNPDDRALRGARATLLADMGKTDAAVADIKTLFDGKSDREVYLSLAQIYDKGKRYTEMAKALDSAEKLSQTKEEKEGVWFMRGAMYEKQKKNDEAEAEFRKVLEMNPGSPGALNYLGYMLADRGVRLPEALEMINKALEKDPNNGAYLDSLGWVLYKMNRLPEAEDNLRRAIVRTPRDATVHDHLGDVLLKEAKVKEAIGQWQISLKEWETSAPADVEPADIAKVKSKLDNAKVRLAKEGGSH